MLQANESHMHGGCSVHATNFLRRHILHHKRDLRVDLAIVLCNLSRIQGCQSASFIDECANEFEMLSGINFFSQSRWVGLWVGVSAPTGAPLCVNLT
jgi:hypothetical protein